jgi:hypothetical protein
MPLDANVVKKSAVERTAPPTRSETWVIVALAAAALLWLVLPPIPQAQSYHHFADNRSLLGIIPNAADVLSNLAFVAVGLLGLLRTRRAAAMLAPATRASIATMFLGFLLTGFGSGYYHWRPDDATLVFDRLPMTIVFAGVVGAIAAERVSQRAGLFLTPLLVVVGVGSVLAWKVTGDLGLYAIVQFGGMLGAIVLLLVTRRGADPFPWWALLAWYVASKIFEAADVTIWQLTGGFVAGHMLKHLTAAVAGLVIANALPRARTAPAPIRG